MDDKNTIIPPATVNAFVPQERQQKIARIMQDAITNATQLCYREVDQDGDGKAIMEFDAQMASEIGTQALNGVIAECIAMNPLWRVIHFMHTGGQETAAEGWTDDPAGSQRQLRFDLEREEHDEYLFAEVGNNKIEVADGLVDKIVISMGSLVAYFGRDKAARLLAEVLDSNDSKFEPDGQGGVKAITREDGKILKGRFYFAPHIAEILEEK